MYGNRALSQDWNGIITEPAANALRYSNVIYDKIKCGNFIKKVAAGLRFRDGHQIGLRIRDAHDIDFSKLFASDVYPAPNGGKVTEKFLEEIVIIIQNYIHTTFDRTTKIVNFHHPHQLMDGINGFNLNVDVEPQSLEQLLVDCQDTLKYGVKTGHPRYFNQLSSGLDIISLAAEWVTSAANTNMFTFEIAPVFVCMEAIVLRKMREIVGWTEKGDGIFSPGGSINNMYAVLMARNRAFPQVKKSGMRACPEMAMFVSKHAHYSNVRPAMALGLGMDNVILIEVDERGRMLPDDLEDKIQKSIKNGIQPFYVTATAGTTVVGAFDPIPEISVICKKYELWLHVDAAWGGGALMSKTYRHLIQGVELADSITWNPHKMMGITLQCSALLTKHEGLLSSCNKMGASYLFQQDKHYDVSYDTGDKTIQCGRHVDVFKLWLAWRGKGDQGFENHVDKCIGLARYMMERIKTLDGFELVFDEPQYSNVCFWYLPKWMRNMEEGADKREKLHKIAPTVKARMMECGSTMVGYQPLDEKVNFFRSVVSNGAVEKEDVDFLLSEIQRLGDDIKPVE